MALKQLWQDDLSADTSSFDVLVREKEPNLLLTLDEGSLRFWLWQSARWSEVRKEPLRLQRDLFCLARAVGEKTILYTDGTGREVGEKSLTPIIPTRTIPIGRLVDDEGFARIICYDHERQSPYYYTPEKPVIDDEFLITPEIVYEAKEIIRLVMQLPRSAKAWAPFVNAGYRFVCLMRNTLRESVQVYGVAPDRIALLDYKDERVLPRWRMNLASIGTPRRENSLIVRMGDPKNQNALQLLVMQATRERVVLTAFA